MTAVDATELDPSDPRVELSVVAGTGEQEFALMVETESSKTLIVNDLIFNLPKLEGHSHAAHREHRNGGSCCRRCSRLPR